MQTLNELLSYFEDCIYWGGWWDSPVDEMHFQMGYETYQNPDTADFIIRKIRSDGFSFFRKGPDAAAIERKPVVPSDGGTYWADVSQYQKRPVDDTYPYGVLCFRTNSGDKVDTLAAANAASALEALDSGGSSLVIPYYFFRPGEENCDLHREVLKKAGLWLHDNTVSMVDVESAGGTITGDNSWEINDEVNRLRGWYGNQRRVVGYWNPNADPGLWLTRPYMLELILPQYNNHPGDLSGVRNNVVVREAFAHQYTDSAKDVAPWSGQGVDMNWTPYTVAELMVLFGMGEEVKAPPTGALELTDADIEELCTAIGAQFLA